MSTVANQGVVDVHSSGAWSSRETVSVVIPCLNERATIAAVVAAAQDAFTTWPTEVEVIVADNGSTDGSVDLAHQAGARVKPTMQTPAIDYFNLRSPFRGLASKVSLRARRRMYSRFIARAGSVPGRRILDLGATADTTLAESNFLELWYPHRSDITIASIEDCSHLEKLFPGTRFERIGPSEPLPFADGQFDIGFCGAVLEHVGGDSSQLRVLAELARTCRKIFLTTPDGAFPVELHTFLPVLHWLPKRLHRRILGLLGQSFWAREENLNLVTRNELRDLTRRALQRTGRSARWSIESHRLCGLSSNLILWIDDRT